MPKIEFKYSWKFDLLGCLMLPQFTQEQGLKSNKIYMKQLNLIPSQSIHQQKIRSTNIKDAITYMLW